LSKKFPKRLDKRFYICYIILASRVSAQAFGTSDDIPVSDLSREDREPLRIQRSELSIMAHLWKNISRRPTKPSAFYQRSGD